SGASVGPSGAPRCNAGAASALHWTTASKSLPPSGAAAAVTTVPQAWAPNSGGKSGWAGGAGGRGGVLHSAGGLGAKLRVKERRGRRWGLGVDVKRKQTLFHAAEILHSGDDFLAWITAFGKIYAAHQVPIRVLRHEEILRRSGDPRDPGADAEP